MQQCFMEFQGTNGSAEEGPLTCHHWCEMLWNGLGVQQPALPIAVGFFSDSWVLTLIIHHHSNALPGSIQPLGSQGWACMAWLMIVDSAISPEAILAHSTNPSAQLYLTVLLSSAYIYSCPLSKPAHRLPNQSHDIVHYGLLWISECLGWYCSSCFNELSKILSQLCLKMDLLPWTYQEMCHIVPTSSHLTEDKAIRDQTETYKSWFARIIKENCIFLAKEAIHVII